MVQPVKQPPGTRTYHVGRSVSLSLPLPAPQLPANAFWKAVGYGSTAWVSAIHMGDPDAVLGSWLGPGLALAFAGIWGMKQEIEYLCFCVPLPFK